nr:hypothetical protein [Desulfobacterales bacterium]
MAPAVGEGDKMRGSTFKNGKLVKNLGIFGGSVAPKFKELAHRADNIVLRVVKSAPGNLELFNGL